MYMILQENCQKIQPGKDEINKNSLYILYIYISDLHNYLLFIIINILKYTFKYIKFSIFT